LAAARSGNLPTVEKLIKSGCNVNQRNLFYTTPLHLACQNDRVVRDARLGLSFGAL
ncbi:unnamed protein product, partial [Hapterophycus canaliculatus]